MVCTTFERARMLITLTSDRARVLRLVCHDA